jgi:hypothetical protein
MDAAEHWLSSGVKKDRPDKAEEDSAAFGVVIVNSGEPEDPEDADLCEVWPENAEALEWWFRLQTQWRVGMSGAVGMEYGVWMNLFDLYEVKDRRQLFEDLQLMEFTVLDKLAEGRSS